MQKIINQIKNHPQIQKRPALKQFIKFSMVGGFNTILDFVIYTSLTRFFQLNYLIANLISFIVAATSSYVLNKTWTFRDKSKKIHTQYLKFLFVSAIGLLLNEGILYLLVSRFKIYDLLAKLVAVGVVMFWNFIMNKFWTFRSERDGLNQLSSSEI